MKIVYALPFEPVVRSRSILVQPVVIANDHYQSIGIVCCHKLGGVQHVARKRSISFILFLLFLMVPLSDQLS